MSVQSGGRADIRVVSICRNSDFVGRIEHVQLAELSEHSCK